MFIEIFRFVEFSGKYFSRLIRTRQLALPMELDDTRCRRENQMLWKRRNWKKPETGTLFFHPGSGSSIVVLLIGENLKDLLVLRIAQHLWKDLCLVLAE